MAISYLPRRIVQIFQQILPKAKGWGNIFRRRVRVFTMALVIYLDYKVLQQREKWASNPNTLWEKAHERNAKRVLSLIVELGGLWVKLGQYMSTRADVLPDAYISRLKLLQDSLPPRPLQEIRMSLTHHGPTSM
nr:putative serine/threonine-protein kinase abkd [Quercus suber]